MLLELSIKDFAIIESLTVSLGSGLNIFTGETGAGKSIIMDALSLVLGERASNDLIRANKDEASVQALFDVSGYKGIEIVLHEAGIEHSESLIIKRVVQRAGRNKIYINGSLATLVTLTEVGRRLIDIYGQSEHQSLTRPEEHIEVLDSFGGFQKMRAYMSESYRNYASVKKELDSLTQESKHLNERRGFIEFQLKEITDARALPGEDEELKKLKERLQNAGKIKNVTAGAESAIYSDAGSVVERLGVISRSLKEIASMDERLKKIAEAIEAALFQLEDASAFLRDYSESIESDPEALETVGARIDLLNKLKKKYGPTVAEIEDKRASLAKELLGLSNLDERSKELEAGLKAAKEKADEAASHLTDARLISAKELEEKIEEELSALGMKGTVFEIAIETDRNPDGSLRFNDKGADRVSFFIATNKGEGLKPLARIASGGELSRIMLAMKSVSAVGRVPTLIFDEIDTGIGGAMAEAVGLKLKNVSKAHQVLCITHQPQIAAFADKHFSVSKAAKDGRTVSSVNELEGGGRVEELSKMLGGVKITDVTRKHALELMENAASLASKKKLARKESESAARAE